MNFTVERILRPTGWILFGLQDLRASWITLLCVVLAPAAAPAAASLLDEDDAVAQVLSRMDERLALMPDVAAWKWKNQAQVVDPKREQVVIDRAVALAQPLGLTREAVQALMTFQVNAASA